MSLTNRQTWGPRSRLPPVRPPAGSGTPPGRRLQASVVLVATLAGLLLPGAGAAAQDVPVLETPPRDSLLLEAGPGRFKEHDLDFELPTTLTARVGEEQWGLRLAGSGLRKKMVFKVYVAVLYADSTADLGADPAAALAERDIARHMVLVLKRDLDGERIADAISRGFVDNVWKAPPDSTLARRLEEYIAFFGGKLKDGQRIEITYLPGHGMFTTVSDAPRPRVLEPRLAQGIWGIWLGPTPISEDLREKLVRHVTPAPSGR